MADIPTIASIERESFDQPWDEKGFLDALMYYSGTFFVATWNGNVVGFVSAGIEQSGDLPYTHILNIGVTPKMRRMGIGGKLLQRIEYEALVKGTAGVQLEVRVSNHTAQSIYQKMGYSQVFVIGGYYPDGEDAILMIKWFEYDED